MTAGSAQQSHRPERPHFIGGFSRLAESDRPARLEASPVYLSSAFGRRLLKANADASPILVDELNAGPFQYGFNGRKRFWIASISADLNVGDCIAVETRSFSEVSDGPTERGSRHSHLCACHRHYSCSIVTCAFGTLTSPP